MTTGELAELKRTANRIRVLTIDAIAHLGVGHIGGALSIADVLVLLYCRHMDADPLDPARPGRDRLVLSKGHAGPVLYSMLADRGFFPAEWLHTLNQGGTRLPSHCDMNRTPGIDMTTGSLGQGLSAAIGICLGNRLDGRTNNVYAIIGDGETNEGQVWEAAMAASQFKLNHLIAFTDYNKLQIDGFMHEVMDIADLSAKWVAFGWFVQRVNGHDFEEMDSAIARAKAELFRPSMIILDTKKGKGADFAENKAESHNMVIDRKAAQEAIALLQEAGI
jgi:transketolase